MTRRDRVEVGLFLPVGGEGMMGGRSAGWNDLRSMARKADDLGYDFVGVLDHLLFHHWECWTLIAALAEATKSIRIVSYVSCTGYRNPALLARMADTVDEISGGRLVLGLGAGDSDSEHLKFGFPTERLVSRFEEAVQIIRTLMTSGRLGSFEGEYYSMHDITLQPRGPSPSGPPILIGSLGGPRMLRLTARYTDVWTASLPATGGTVEGFQVALDRLHAACSDAGRDPATLKLMVEVVVRLPGAPVPAWCEGHVVQGDLEEIETELRRFLDSGAGQLMLWLEPNSIDGIEHFGPVVTRLKS